MNGFARHTWQSFDGVVPLRKVTQTIEPHPSPAIDQLYQGWRQAVNQLIK